MENRKEENGWMSVPQFGGWNQKSKRTDYSKIFQRARVNRMQYKTDLNRTSPGNGEEVIAPQCEQSPSKRNKILSYLNCCIKA